MLSGAPPLDGRLAFVAKAEGGKKGDCTERKREVGLESGFDGFVLLAGWGTEVKMRLVVEGGGFAAAEEGSFAGV